MTSEQNQTVFQRAGGEETFFKMVEKFYEGVAGDPVLRPMYPVGDLKSASRKLALFLMQYFGGPATYSQERGHPRLRQRHFPFAIDRAARDAWMGHMREGVRSVELPADVEAEILDYLEHAATFLVNQQEPLQLR